MDIDGLYGIDLFQNRHIGRMGKTAVRPRHAQLHDTADIAEDHPYRRRSACPYRSGYIGRKALVCIRQEGSGSWNHPPFHVL